MTIEAVSAPQLRVTALLTRSFLWWRLWCLRFLASTWATAIKATTRAMSLAANILSGDLGGAVLGPSLSANGSTLYGPLAKLIAILLSWIDCGQFA